MVPRALALGDDLVDPSRLDRSAQMAVRAVLRAAPHDRHRGPGPADPVGRWHLAVAHRSRYRGQGVPLPIRRRLGPGILHASTHGCRGPAIPRTLVALHGWALLLGCAIAGDVGAAVVRRGYPVTVTDTVSLLVPSAFTAVMTYLWLPLPHVYSKGREDDDEATRLALVSDFERHGCGGGLESLGRGVVPGGVETLRGSVLTHRNPSEGMHLRGSDPRRGTA